MSASLRFVPADKTSSDSSAETGTVLLISSVFRYLREEACEVKLNFSMLYGLIQPWIGAKRFTQLKVGKQLK
jgi:hypothetical protein